MLITFEISLFGENYNEKDAELFPTLDTDLSVKCDLLPPTSLLLPAMVLGECRGLPLDEFEVSDGERRATVLRQGGRYLLPITPMTARASEVQLSDAGVDILLSSYSFFNTDFLILRCDELSLFDKRLAPRLLMKADGNVFLAYEKRGESVEFFAYSPSIRKGLLPTAALVLHSHLGARRLTSNGRVFDFEYHNGKPHLLVRV